MIKRLIGCLLFSLMFVMGINVYANTGTQVISGSSQESGTLVNNEEIINPIQGLKNHLEMERTNIYTLLARQQSSLLQAQKEAQDMGETGSYEAIMCLTQSGNALFDWSLPFTTLQEAIDNDYIALSTKIHSAELTQKIHGSGTVNLEALQIQIVNFGKNYQETILQLSQQTQDRFTQNKNNIQQLVMKNQAQLNTIYHNKKLIEGLLKDYESFTQQLRTSRLLQGLTFQEFAKSKDILKERFLKGVKTILTHYVEQQLQQNNNLIGFKDNVTPLIDQGVYTFEHQFDTWFEQNILKNVDNTSLSTINGTIDSVKSLYYHEGKLTCGVLLSMTNTEQQLLEQTHNQIINLANNMEGSGKMTDVEINNMKKEYLKKIETFYTVSVSSIVKSTKQQLLATQTIYQKLLGQELDDLATLGLLNKQYRETYEPAIQQQLKQKMCPIAQKLKLGAIHTTILERSTAIIQHVCLTSPNANDSQTRDTSNASVSGDSSITSSTSKTSQSSIDQAVHDYIADLVNKYPDPTTQQQAIHYVIKNIDTAIAQGKLDQTTTLMYTKLKTELQKRVQ